MEIHPNDVMTIGYDWIVETVDEHGDIVDADVSTKLVDALFAMRFPLPENQHYELGLVRDRGSFSKGLVDRQWAYVENGVLPSVFDEGAKVPKKYLSEFARDYNIKATS